MLATVSFRGETALKHIGTLSVDYLLTPDEALSLQDLGQDFDVSSTGGVFLRSGTRLICAGRPPGERAPAVLDLRTQCPQSFAIDSRDTLLAVHEGFLAKLEENGDFADAIPLPFDNARLAHSIHDGAVYLFEGSEDDHRLYRFLEDGTFQILLKSDAPIVGVGDSGTDVYVATPSLVLRLAPGSPVCVFKAPDTAQWGPIVSLAVSPDSGLLFFSTSQRVYALQQGVALSIINNAGGTLRVRGDKLYVMDRKRHLLLAFSPASRAMFSKGAP